ncbi:uncharacterized protein LOC119958367 isoform X3 [Scyliorhinus canicula]|uniref:uncharacterized protein LOC119958367 isoform X3 n=1 Tax=Scyliorhinus canicula TaxID=7830 RepID=UPI0018F6DF14|nr:uncharacterized protein LOC119958367 isoform X3 [Scyliorhinus canicula]
MVSRRLRNRVSLGMLEEDAQLDMKSETPSPVNTVQRTRLTRSTFKKVEDMFNPSEQFLLWFQTPIPRQSSGCRNGTPVLPPAMETQETPRRQLRQRLVHTQASAEDSPRRSARNVSWMKSTSPGERRSQQGGCDGGNSEPEDGDELSEVQRTETPDRESEKVRETEKTTPKMPQPDTGAENLRQAGNSDGRCLLKVHLGKRSPMSDSQRDTGVKCNANDDDSPVLEIEAPDTESEKTKEHQNHARRKSLRISKQLNPNSSTISYEDICLGHNASEPEEGEDTNCRPDAAKHREMQASSIKGRVEEELEVEKLEQDHVEMGKEEGKEEPGPCNISASFELEPGSLSGTDACRSSTQGDGNPGAVQTEAGVEGGIISEPLMVGDETGGMIKLETDKAETLEAVEEVEGVHDQTEAISINLDQEVEDQDMEKSEETPKSALRLILSNLDSSKNFGELQIAIISFFMIRRLSVTSISLKKSRKRGHVTFVSGKDVSRALKYDGQQLLGRALQLRRPQRVQKPVAIVKGRKRKLKESDRESASPSSAKMKNGRKSSLLTRMGSVSLLRKKKKKTREQAKKAEGGEGAPPPKKKKRSQEIGSWCVYIQKVRSREILPRLKTAIGDFLHDRSVAFKEIVLYPDSFSACVELCCEDDMNEALKFDPRKTFGQAATISKVEKLGALVDGSDPRTLCVRNLPSEVHANDLKNLFGGVAGIWLQECQTSSKRFAFIAFDTSEAAASALSEGGVECKGKRIRLKRTCPRSNEEMKVLVLKNLPRPFRKKYLKSVFRNAVAVRVSQDKQSHRIAQVEYRTAKEANAALKGLRGKGVPPQQAICVASMEGMKKRPECKPGGPGSTCSLFVWGISTETTVEMLKSTFRGAVNARLSQNAGSRSALVDFRTAADAARTRVEMQGVEIDGHKVKLFFANFASGMQGASRDPRVI